MFRSGFFLYYLGWVVLTFLLANPWLLAGIVAVYLIQPFIPDPLIWLRSWKNIRALRKVAHLNPANVVARRDLARSLLDRGRPREAREVLGEALARKPDDAELRFLLGRALLASSEPDAALEELGHALDLDPSLGQGDPYLLAGDAHRRMGRYEEASEAYAHAAEENHSSVVARARLASVLAASGDRERAARARSDASRTYEQLPAYLRRAARGAYWRMQVEKLFA